MVYDDRGKTFMQLLDALRNRTLIVTAAKYYNNEWSVASEVEMVPASNWHYHQFYLLRDPPRLVFDHGKVRHETTGYVNPKLRLPPIWQISAPVVTADKQPKRKRLSAAEQMMHALQELERSGAIKQRMLLKTKHNLVLQKLGKTADDRGYGYANFSMALGAKDFKNSNFQIEA